MINFNELLAKDLADYLHENQEWFLGYEDDGWPSFFVSRNALQEVIEGFFKQHEQPVPALLRKKD